MAQVEVRLTDITKTFKKTVAVDRLNLEIEKGEFFAVLGPSGCGKTTTLRTIAGLAQPTSGQVFIRDRDVTDVPTHKRNIGMVFQDYALFPHMTITDNIAFGLRMRGWPKSRIEPRISELLDLIRLPGIGPRYPRQLSGGQQQRVALARALAPEPAVLLLDEPLSNLDLKLRQELRLELRRIQRELGITTIFVTHDQGEALSLSDRIMVMQDGHAIQQGKPAHVYEHPNSKWVASFLGDANVFAVTRRANGDPSGHFVTPGGLAFRAPVDLAMTSAASSTVPMLAIRPEVVRLFPLDSAPEGDEYDVFQGSVENFAYSGAGTRYVLKFEQSASDRVLVDVPESGIPWSEGTRLKIAFPRKKWMFLAA